MNDEQQIRMTSDGNKGNLHTTLLPSEQFHHSKTTSYPPF